MSAHRPNNKVLPWLSLPIAVAGYFFVSRSWAKIAPKQLAEWGTWCGVLFSIVCLAIGLKAGLTRGESKRVTVATSDPAASERKTESRPVVAAEEDSVEELSSMPPPRCPKCRRQMVLRRAKTGPKAGQQFWGCSSYPKCRGTLAVVVPKQFGR